MKDSLFLKLFVTLLFISGSLTVSAHMGGHYHRSDKSVLNTWQLKDGRILKGNFSAAVGDYIILEEYDGKTIRVQVNQLSEQDQKLALFKIKKYNSLNRPAVSITEKGDYAEKYHLNVSWLLISALLGLLSLFLLAKLLKPVWAWGEFKFSYSISLSYLFLIFLSIIACKKSSDNITSIIPKTRTSFIDSAFTAYKPFISTNWDNNYFYVSGTGFPQHNMMVGITSWQQQVPIPQYYTGSNSWSIPLQPEYASVPLSTKTNLMKGAVAIAINGIPIFNAFNNRGVDSYLTGELDNWGGHCGRADDYHYHIAPLHLSPSSANMPIAFAMDGFAVYGNKEPDGSTMQGLDTCHGHSINNGVYHYHGTTSYPYVVGAMRGKVNLDPNTAAPENQVIPQAFASPVRPALTPLNGATITAFQSTAVNAYKLTYRQGARNGYVEYSWDATNKYTYKITDTSGAVTINIYQR